MVCVKQPKIIYFSVFGNTKTTLHLVYPKLICSDVGLTLKMSAFETLNGSLYTLSTQLIIPKYQTTDAVPQFLKKLIPFTLNIYLSPYKQTSPVLSEQSYSCQKHLPWHVKDQLTYVQHLPTDWRLVCTLCTFLEDLSITSQICHQNMFNP